MLEVGTPLTVEWKGLNQNLLMQRMQDVKGHVWEKELHCLYNGKYSK
jgi:hypothetical protein